MVLRFPPRSRRDTFPLDYAHSYSLRFCTISCDLAAPNENNFLHLATSLVENSDNRTSRASTFHDSRNSMSTTSIWIDETSVSFGALRENTASICEQLFDSCAIVNLKFWSTKTNELNN